MLPTHLLRVALRQLKPRCCRLPVLHGVKDFLDNRGRPTQGQKIEFGAFFQNFQICGIRFSIDQKTLTPHHRGVEVIGRGKPPAFWRQNETMVPEMIVRIPDADAEGNATKKFFQIRLHIGAAGKEGLHEIKIPVACRGAVAIR